MAVDFYRFEVNDESFVRNPGRLLWADMSQAAPRSIEDIIDLSTYEARGGWNDIGATKGGVTVNFNNSEETFDIDQVMGDIETLPNNAEMSVATNLSQVTLDWLAFAWEGDSVTVNTDPDIPEKVTGFGTFERYTQRRLAIGVRKRSGKLRFFFFHKAQRSPQESSLAFNKEGEQQQIPFTWKILPDTSIAEIRRRFMIAFDQQ